MENNFLEKVRLIINHWILFSIVITPALIVWKMDQLEAKITQPIIIYQVDNSGGLMTGKITDKEIIDGRYTVTVEAYGKFLVTKEQYEEIEIGQEMPEYLKGRGS
ncbi:DUF1372 family protein [Streptococcus porci]|uniref:DUF1372 family protein n=1 Tax=Streptococcus porci TaxID=502567 RepID=UPI0003FBAFA6|nr:DUF1372 family protein [Streptococcus porci]